jgi:uncharacterized protein YndB with AHSA1/START domain
MASIAPAAQSVSDLTLNIEQEIHVGASLDQTFAALLEQLGPENTGGDGKPMPMKIEAWPGGRWFRDLGANDGHFWGHVQAIKRPTLLEICGPLMVSSPVYSNVQYRLTEVEGGTLIKFHHFAFGFVADGFKSRVNEGWKGIHERVRKAAERKGLQ